MKSITKFFVFLLLCTFTQQAEAQFLKKLKKAVTEAVEDKTIEKIADEAADEAGKTLDKAFEDAEEPERTDGGSKQPGSRSQNSSEEKLEDRMSNLGGLMEGIMKDVKTESSYSFDVTVTMEVADSKKKKNVMTQSYSNTAMLSSVQNTVSIFDFTNEAFVILDEDKKTAQVMSMSWMKTMGMGAYNESEVEDNNVTFKKTGKTKRIHGYDCTEYEMTHEDGRMECWIAEKTDFNFADYLIGFSKMFDTKAIMHPEFSDKGYMMAMMSYSKKGNLQNSMEVIDISKKTKTIDLDTYKLQKMNGVK